MSHAIVVGLGYGDEGKGTVVDRLCASRAGTDERVRLVVRFNGGCQAGHNVVLPDGRWHTFSQFGSGAFHGVPTYLSQFMLVEPLSLRTEAIALEANGVPSPLDILYVDREALVTTPYHKLANRARENRRGDGRHGSCGRGIGETMKASIEHPGDAVRVRDLRSPLVLRKKLGVAAERLRAEFTEDELGPLPDMDDLITVYLGFTDEVVTCESDALSGYLEKGDCVFEGAQGVLLDENYGFDPYTTWSTTTFANAEALLAGAGMAGMADRIGVVRSHTTRHGRGPLVTEDAQLLGGLTDAHNTHNRWQEGFRVGHFDAVAHRYAIAACRGVDKLAVTHLDRVPQDLRICHAYEWAEPWTATATSLVPPLSHDPAARERITRELMQATPLLSDFMDSVWPSIEAALGPPVVMMSYGPTHLDKKERAPSYA